MTHFYGLLQLITIMLQGPVNSPPKTRDRIWTRNHTQSSWPPSHSTQVISRAQGWAATWTPFSLIPCFPLYKVTFGNAQFSRFLFSIKALFIRHRTPRSEQLRRPTPLWHLVIFLTHNLLSTVNCTADSTLLNKVLKIKHSQFKLLM